MPIAIALHTQFEAGPVNTVIASEAKQSRNVSAETAWIASSQELLAMTEHVAADVALSDYLERVRCAG
jgi:hypothetical protein